MFQWLRNMMGGGPAGAPQATPAQQGRFRARYDNATTTPENARNWWAADVLSAKAANSFQVRRQLRTRSRYEVANNPYLCGIVNNNADDLIGTGPTLQLRTPSDKYNRLVEREYAAWSAEVAWNEKLRTSKLAKTVDGEGFLVFKTLADLDHAVKLYPCDIEADQVTTPAPQSMEELWVDGITLHKVTGRPTHFHVLRHHPGDYYFPSFNPLVADRIPARYIVHWFPKFRPGQVRGIPVFTSSLDLFAELRAYRRAVLGAAEIAADYAAVIEQDRETGAYVTEDDTDAEYQPFSRVPIDRKQMTMLPPGAKMSQFDPKQPTTSYESFQEKCLGEAVRPLSYPLNLALGTSQKFNFSSAKLDHINYRASLDVERADCNRVACTPTFSLWYEEAVLAGVIPPFDGMRVPPHEWHWPGHTPIDPMADADADHARLSNGTMTLREFWARRGFDWKDVLAQLAAERDEVEKQKLQFGEPATKTITEDGDAPDEGGGDGGDREPVAALARELIRAVKDANNQEHDEKGRFGEGGGGGGKKDDDKGGGGKSGEKSGASPTSPTGAKPDVKHLENAVQEKKLHGGVGIRRDKDNKPWVVKDRNGRGDQAANEKTAADLAQKAGVNVVPVHHEKLHGQDAIVVEHVEGKDLAKMSEGDRREALSKIPKEQIDKHVLFDYAVGSKDPNNGNFMLTNGGKSLTAIDKEQSMDHGMGKSTEARPPFFLNDVVEKGKSALDHKLDRKEVENMAKAAHTMADDLAKQGKKSAAAGVRARAEVLDKLAKGSAEPTVGEMMRLGDEANKTTAAKKGFFKRVFGKLFGG